MLGTRPDETADDRPSDNQRLTSTALVPLAEPARRSASTTRFPAPDPTFVTQLIANAERQSQRGRRESATDALSAYRARQRGLCGAGALTHQMI